MTIRLHVTDRDGVEYVLDVSAEGSLMEVLRDLEYGVTAICGGMCACASCHIYAAREWTERLPVQQPDEHDMLSDLQYRQAESRLACQIALSDALDGLRLTLAPEE